MCNFYHPDHDEYPAILTIPNLCQLLINIGKSQQRQRLKVEKITAFGA